MKKFKGIEVNENEVTIIQKDTYSFIFDKNHEVVYFERDDGFWARYVYDENSDEVYFENSDGYFRSSIFDKNHNVLYCEDSDGKIEDYRSKK